MQTASCSVPVATLTIRGLSCPCAKPTSSVAVGDGTPDAARTREARALKSCELFVFGHRIERSPATLFG